GSLASFQRLSRETCVRQPAAAKVGERMSIPADAFRWVEPERLEPGSLWWTPEGQWWLIVQMGAPMRGEKYGLGVMGAAAGKLRPLGGQREGYALSAGYDWL